MLLFVYVSVPCLLLYELLLYVYMSGLNKCFPSFLFPNQWYRPGRFWEVGDSSALDAGRSSQEEECCRWELHQGFGQSHGEMVLTRKYAQCCKTRFLLVVVPFSRWFYKLMRLHHLRFWIWLDVVFSWFKCRIAPNWGYSGCDLHIAPDQNIGRSLSLWVMWERRCIKWQ